MGETKISLNIEFTEKFDRRVHELNNEGRKTSKAVIMRDLISEFKKSIPQAEGFMRPLRELDKDVRISFSAIVDGNPL
jgi:hypothetical protein